MRKLLGILMVFLLFFPGIVFGKMEKNSKPKNQLQGIFLKGLKKPVKGDKMQAALKSVEDLMKPRGVKFEKKKDKETGFKLKNKEVKEDKLGHKHIRLLQYYKGLPVIGGELIVHINKQDIIYTINGKYLSPIDVSIEPPIDGDTALQTGLKEHEKKPELEVTKEPSLVIYDSHLAWYFVISHEGSEPGQWWYYVDAHTGELILRYNNIQYICNDPTSNGSYVTVTGNRLVKEGGEVVEMTGWYDANNNSYYLYNDADNWGIWDDAAIDCWVTNNTPNWDDSARAAISAGYNLSLTQAWVENFLNRDSYDNNGGFARANVNSSTDADDSFWNDHYKYFQFGIGYIKSSPLTVLDVVAHEFGHAITTSSDASQLQYWGESGALHESYSDIMATAVEFYYQDDGRSSYPYSVYGHDDWLMGEDCWEERYAMRDLRDPQRFGHASRYRGQDWCTDIDGKDKHLVHANCGVQNFAFYLLAEGGMGMNDGLEYNITGIGIAKAAEVAMRANIDYLTSRDQFFDSREAWIAVAEADPNIPESTVEAVWDAVGVFPPKCKYDETIISHEFFGDGNIVCSPCGDNESFNYDLPFVFPFFCNSYSSVKICTNGFLDFVKYDSDRVNHLSKLIENVRIAPFWKDLSSGTIFIHQPDANSICIRWDAAVFGIWTEVNFEVVLYQDGRIQFNYGNGNLTYIDENVDWPPTIGISAGNGIHYCVSAYNQYPNLSYADSILFTPQPITDQVPADVDASDGMYTDRVEISWWCTDGADSYKIYRADSIEGIKTPIQSDNPTNSYTDTSTTPGYKYYYWITAMSGAEESDFSVPDSGWRKMAAPSGSATYCEYTDRIEITWGVVDGADAYDIFRADSIDDIPVLIQSMWETNLYIDTNVSLEQKFYYWTQAVNAFSESDLGSIGDGSIKPLPPSNVQATNGTFTDRVEITWDSAPGVPYYYIFRADSIEGEEDYLSYTETTSYSDTSAIPGYEYYYWVKSGSSFCISEFSSPDSGWRNLTPPTNVQASDGTYTDKVEITWASVTGASSYNVYRADSIDGTKTAIKSGNTTTSYSDTTATPGYQFYYYWVTAVNGATESAFSSPDSGWKNLPDVLNFQNETLSSGTYAANDSITAGSDVTVESEAVITFLAENSINLSGNFIIEENAYITFDSGNITAETFIIRSGATAIFKASDSIIAGPNFIIESGAEVHFEAGSYIRLLNEFTANVGSLFDAVIQ